MKKHFLLMLFIVLSSAAQAALYENTSYNDQVPAYLKSMVVDDKGCETEGVLVKFYGTTKNYNFCKGFEEVSKYEYKKCVGREVGGYPFGRRCIGYRKTVVEITKKFALIEGTKMSSIQTTHRDGELIHKDVMVLELDGDQAVIETSFINNDWIGSGEASYLFIRSDR